MQDLVDRLYREHAAALTARLTRAFGVAHIEHVEAIVQETFVVALKVWPERGVPDAPLAWLTTVAKNRAKDQLRRDAWLASRVPEIQGWVDAVAEAPSPAFEGEITDDLLRMLFVACHPDLPVEGRLALALRTLCSFSTLDIARALLTTEAAIEKRLVRARARLRESGVSFELPAPEALLERSDAVLTVLYLLFSEGYHAHSGERVIKVELCHDAMRLARLLAVHPVTRSPRTSALVALFCLQAARLEARFDDVGDIVPLADQDRGRWEGGLIAEGLRHLDDAGSGASVSAYHLQAGIAACHALAPSFGATRWSQIIRFYDLLRVVEDSPIVALNRAIAVSYGENAAAGLQIVDELAREPRFQRFALLHAARADMLRRLDRGGEAVAAYDVAADLAGTEAERRFLARRASLLQARSD